MKNIFAAETRAQTTAAFLRISLGTLFAIAAWHKIAVIDAKPSWADRMLGFINAHQNTYEWWRAFLDSVVVPNPNFFAYLSAYGEGAIALGLILGALTRPAIVFALVFAFAMMLTKGTPFWTPSSNDTLYVLSLAALFFMQPGHTLSLDVWIKKTFRKFRKERKMKGQP